MSRSSLGVVLRGLPAHGRSVTFPVWRKRCTSRTMMEWLTLKFFSNNELISNRFVVFVICTHILTYLWNRLLIDFYLCVYDRVCKVPRVLFNICVCVTVFLACQITIKNVQVQLTVKGKTTPDSYTPTPKSSCTQNVVVLKLSVSTAVQYSWCTSW
jgi:hypothetical protein